MKRSLLVCLLCWWLLIDIAIAETTTANDAREIQILIDVSGSMKQNDPRNMRTAATQLLVNLLPDHAKTDLWLFAEKTESISHSDAVDQRWRKQALKDSKRIHSRGLYTNIEDAIAKVLQNGFSGEGEKNLVLLTDGMVDISPDIMVSADSRERILTEWIPRLRQHGIKVQTIALSEQADRELLEKLAYDTDGWYETAESADQLQRLFSKMAQKVAPKDMLPLQDNRFHIDPSIQEFSVLVFKSAGNAPTQLIKPDGKKISQRNALSEGTAWLDRKGYDLITVKTPITGNWRIAAEIDPDNRIMVLTDLKLQLEGLDNFVTESAEPVLKLHFSEKNQLIDRRNFLELIKLEAIIDRQEAQAILALSEQTGYFATTLKGLSPGKHSLSILADGKTFKREIVKDFEVISAPIQLEPSIDHAKRQVTLKLLPDKALLDTSSLFINATLHQDPDVTESRTLTEQNGEWQLTVDSPTPGTTISVHFNISAKTVDGKAISPALSPFPIDDSLFTAGQATAQTDSTPTPVSAEAQKQPDSQSNQLESSQEAEISPDINDEPKTEENQADWNITIALVIAGNLLLLGLSYFAYKTFKSVTQKQQQQILERLS